VEEDLCAPNAETPAGNGNQGPNRGSGKTSQHRELHRACGLRTHKQKISRRRKLCQRERKASRENPTRGQHGLQAESEADARTDSRTKICVDKNTARKLQAARASARSRESTRKKIKSGPEKTEIWPAGRLMNKRLRSGEEQNSTENKSKQIFS
jgi:hypothetical protein